MTQIFNKASEKEKRRTLRNDMPKAEIIVWSQLKGKQMLGYKFRRQYSVGPYVLDFYCPSLNLAVEIDGESHFQEGAAEYDRQRQVFIESLGIRVLRFTNTEVFENLQGVLIAIEQTVRSLLRPKDPPVSPLRKGGFS